MFWFSRSLRPRFFAFLPLLGLYSSFLLLPPVLRAANLTFTAWNTGLLATNQNYDARKSLVAEELVSSSDDPSPDVICLQEIWDSNVQRELFLENQALTQIYPYHHNFPTSFRPNDVPQKAAGQAYCEFAQILSALNCLTSQGCLDFAQSDPAIGLRGLQLCAQTRCQSVAESLVGSGCLRCALQFLEASGGASGGGGGAAPQALDMLTLQNVLLAQCGAGAKRYFFTGGLLMLSKYPLWNTDFIQLEDMFEDRGILYAEVLRRHSSGTPNSSDSNSSLSGSAPIRRSTAAEFIGIGCTHFSPDYSRWAASLPPSSSFQFSYPFYQTQQLTASLGFLQGKVTQTPNQLFMGDFNFGSHNEDNSRAGALWSSLVSTSAGAGGLQIAAGFTSAYESRPLEPLKLCCNKVKRFPCTGSMNHGGREGRREGGGVGGGGGEEEGR